MRVHELAKKYGKSSKEMIDLLAKNKIDVKSHMTNLEEEQVAKITRDLESKKDTNKPKAEKKIKHKEEKKDKVEKKSSEVKKEDKETLKKKKDENKGKAKPRIEEKSPEVEKIVAEVLEMVDSEDDIEDIPVIFEKIETKRQKADKAKREQQKKKQSKPEKEEKPVEKEVTEKVIRTNFPVAVKSLATKMGRSVNEVLSKLLKLGIIASINQMLDEDTAAILAEEFGFKIEEVVTLAQQKFTVDVVEEKDKLEDLKNRAPVVTFMGHVDHGKTSLLDTIRKTDVVSSESGGITQHIGAYEVEVTAAEHKGKITFLDTPGHEAFTAMRARGANVTDICVLVVAADDGLMPQSIEAISHIKAAKTAFIVAINKIDRPNAQVERVKNQLLQHELVPEEFGGDTIIVGTSAVTKEGIDDLLEMILLQAEMLELKANPNKKAKGVVIESRLTQGKGATVTVLIQNGTLKIGDFVICGTVSGKVRAMSNYRGEKVTEAGPSVPVEVLGLSEVPNAGDAFYVVRSEKETKFISEARKRLKEETESAARTNITLEDIYQQIETDKLKDVKLIVKADVQGSIGAIAQVIRGLKSEEVKAKIIHSAAGAINESDVMLAKASNAVIIGFRVKLESASIADLCKREGVSVRFYDVIYKIVDDVKAAMEGLLEPEREEKFLGNAEVRQVFKISRLGAIAGCMVTSGKIQRNGRVRVKRGDSVLMETSIASLKKFQEEAKEIPSGAECGIRLENFNSFEIGDNIEVFEIEEKKRKLS